MSEEPEKYIVQGVIVPDVVDATGTVLSEEAVASITRQWQERIEHGGGIFLSSGVTIRSADLDDKAVLLAQVEQEARELQATIQRAQWGVLRLLERIRDQDLYRAAVNPATGEFYTSFTQYLPDLIERWHSEGLITQGSVKQVYDYQRVERIFLNPANGFDVDADEIIDLGITHFTTMAEALDYDRETGLVAETPRAGKATKAQVSDIITTLRAQDAWGRGDRPWTVQSTRAELNEQRGVHPKSVTATLRRLPDGRHALVGVTVFLDGIGQKAEAGLDDEALAHFLKRIGCKTPTIIT
jgi:hypothetical protein